MKYGPVAGYDRLGRKLPMIEDVGPKRKDKYVGIFYFVHRSSSNEKRTVVNVDKLLKETPEAALDYDHPAWGTGRCVYHWGEPLFGYYAAACDATRPAAAARRR